MKLPFPGIFSSEKDYSKVGLVLAAIFMPTALMFVVFVVLSDYWGNTSLKGKYLAFPVAFAIMLVWMFILIGLGTLVNQIIQ